MILERTKNSFRNIFWGYIQNFISLLFPFTIRTILIYELGAEYLGLNSLFSSLLTVFSLAELGFSSAIVFNMYKPVADNDIKKICALLSFYKNAYKCIGCVILFLGLISFPFIHYLIKSDCPQDVNIYVLYFLFLLNSVLSYFLFSYKNSLFSVYQREDVISKIEIISKIILFLLQLFFLLVYKNYYLFVFSMVLSTITSNLIVHSCSCKIFPELKCKGKISIETKNNLKKNIAGLSIGKVCLISRNTFDNIFLSYFLGLNVVAIYSNYFYVMNAVSGFLLILMTSISAGIGNSLVTNTEEKNFYDFKKISFMYSWISSWCVVCLFCLYQPFMKIWMGENMLFPMIDVLLLCVYFYLLTIGEVRARYSSATGLFWESKNYIIIEALFNIILNFVLGKYFGVSGVILASCISLLIINFCYGSKIIFKHYFKHYSMFPYFASHLHYALVALISCYCTYCITSLFENIFVKALICCFIPNMMFVLLYFKNKEFKESILFIKYHMHM